MTRTALGYLAIPPDIGFDDPARTVEHTAILLGGFAAEHGGYALTKIFTDLRGVTEGGLYRLMQAVRQGEAGAVVVPDLDHLRAVGCLAGADLRVAERYLRVRVLMMRPDPGRRDRHPARGEDDRYASAAAYALARRRS